MTEQEADRKKGIEALLVERKKFEAWLAQLESKRTAAVPHVFDRVYADYTKRLEDVRAKLIAEADTLKSLVTDLESRLAKEQDKVTKKSDERAEAELRAMVGEFSEKDWTTTKARLDASIADLRAKFDGTERELADLKELSASVSGAPAPARASVMVAAEATVAAALHEAEGVAPPPVEATDAKSAESAAGESKTVETIADEPPPRKPTPFDELAFLRSVGGTPSRPSGNAAVPAVPAERRAAEDSPVPSMVPPPMLEEPAEGAAESDAPIEDSAVPRTRDSAKVAEAAAPLGAPTPRTSQAIRSLKCQECGTLNFPTEWYCERCGGELAAF